MNYEKQYAEQLQRKWLANTRFHLTPLRCAAQVKRYSLGRKNFYMEQIEYVQNIMAEYKCR
jgi:hypothetical protein